jgi:fatty acid desaturase
MGRRSRTRERAARPAPAQPVAAAGRPRRGRLGMLNPFSFQRPSRSRVRWAAIAFAVLAVLFAVLGWVTDTGAWFNSAVLLVILALLWGARAAFMREDDRSS